MKTLSGKKGDAIMTIIIIAVVIGLGILIMYILGPLLGIFGAFSDIFNFAMGAVSGFFQWTAGAIGGFANWIGGGLSAIGSGIGGFGHWVNKGIGGLTSQIGAGFKGLGTQFGKGVGLGTDLARGGAGRLGDLASGITPDIDISPPKVDLPSPDPRDWF